MRNLLLFIITSLFTLSLASCISINRSIKLNADGSGTEDMRMTMDKEYLLMLASFATAIDSNRKQEIMNALYNDSSYIEKIKLKEETLKGVRVIDASSVTTPDSAKVITVIYDFDDISALEYSLMGTDDMNGTTDSDILMKDNGNTVSFEYRITNKNDMKENDEAGSSLKADIMELFKDDKLTVNIEMPYDVVSSNAHSSSGRILTWQFDIMGIMSLKEPIVMTAEMRK